MENGFVQVYTGDGKGKTTAAIGLTIRALGAGKRVAFLQYMKAVGYSEHKILRNLSPNLFHKTIGKPFFIAKEGSLSDAEIRKYASGCVVFSEGNPPSEYVRLIEEGVALAKECLTGGAYDLVVLDELNCALFFGLVSWETVRDLMETRSPKTELVITGRGAPQALLDAADLVTEMREIKHYYERGVPARVGIEN
jgi:cob(I)alamin adenosyltransferase